MNFNPRILVVAVKCRGLYETWSIWFTWRFSAASLQGAKMEEWSEREREDYLQVFLFSSNKTWSQLEF